MERTSIDNRGRNCFSHRMSPQMLILDYTRPYSCLQRARAVCTIIHSRELPLLTAPGPFCPGPFPLPGLGSFTTLFEMASAWLAFLIIAPIAGGEMGASPAAITLCMLSQGSAGITLKSALTRSYGYASNDGLPVVSRTACAMPMHDTGQHLPSVIFLTRSKRCASLTAHTEPLSVLHSRRAAGLSTPTLSSSC